ncbi:MAG: outer membrane beta-barrel protein, partial [Polyangiaceae bacterium]
LQSLPNPDKASSPAPAPAAPAAPKTVQAEHAPPPPPPPPPPPMYRSSPPGMTETPGEPPTYVYVRPRRPPISPLREWGLNLRFEGVPVAGVFHNSGLFGAGTGLRYKPTRFIGIEGDLDFIGGRGYLGEHRSETALALNGMVFLNPRSQAQVYVLAGLGWSGAHVTCDPASDACSSSLPQNGLLDEHYVYFGGQVGVGLEARLDRHLALNADLRAFIRGRVDDLSGRQPEFIDTNGQTTNASGGALITAGATIYF